MTYEDMIYEDEGKAKGMNRRKETQNGIQH